jgi:hypothetical protein
MTRKLIAIDHERIPGFFNAMEARAKSLADSAGFSGSWGDNGAGHLRERVECWRAGLENRVPDALEDEFDEYSKTQDPEYNEFLRLKNKFEGK